MREVPEGCRVVYRHQRFYRWTAEGGAVVDSRGGVTVAMIVDADGRVRSQGYAYCRPDENFEKRVGREVALDRALGGPGESETLALREIAVAARRATHAIRRAFIRIDRSLARALAEVGEGPGLVDGLASGALVEGS